MRSHPLAHAIPRTARDLLQTVGTGLLIAASWHDARLFLSLWIGLCWFFWMAASTTRPFLMGFVTGSIALSTAFYWTPAALAKTIVLPEFTVWILITLMIAWEAIPFGLIALFTQRQITRSSHSWWLIPAAWVVLEAFWPRIFPWSFAYSQTDVLPLLQLAEWTGAPGVSFVILAVSILPAIWQQFFASAASLERSGSAVRRPLVYTAAAIGLLTLVLAGGDRRLRQWENISKNSRAIHAAIVQIDPRHTTSIEKMRHHVLEKHEPVDLICWPESTLGTYCTRLTSFCDEQVTRRQSVLPRVDAHPSRGLPCDLVAGGKSYEPGRSDAGPFFQTAYLIRPDETIVDRYIKRTLMPIGEYIPGQTVFPATRAWVDLSEPIMTGTDPRPLQLSDGTRAGTLMCYEDMVAKNARDTVAAGAELLICLINGSAFENPLILEQHMRLALLRAVENRRVLARCAATGVSCVIAPTGQMTARVAPQSEASMVARLPRVQQLTVFTRYGHLFPWLCMASVAYLPLSRFARAARRRPCKRPAST